MINTVLGPSCVALPVFLFVADKSGLFDVIVSEVLVDLLGMTESKSLVALAVV
jgi:hypothetical protein